MTNNSNESTGRFNVVTASAGSGKTFRLVFEYLRFALVDPAENYKKILAITFTNKATKEMKSRILDAARAFSQADARGVTGRDKALWDTLIVSTGYTPAELQHRSKIFYDSVLHNYSEFNVSTIDSFSQRIIRSFAYELKVPQQFDVELNASLVYDKIVRRLLASVGQDKLATRLLQQITVNNLDDFDNTNIRKELLKSAKVMMEDDSQEPICQMDDIGTQNMLEIYNRIRNKRNALYKRLRELAQASLDCIQRHNRTTVDFKGKGGSFANTYNKMLKDDFVLTKTFCETINGERNWLTAKNDDEVADLKVELTPLGFEIIEKAEQFPLYNLLNKCLPKMITISLLHRAYKEVQQEENLMLIAEFNHLISGQVKYQPAPFIYEKIGSKFSYFLIDEFQDTGVLQFHNLVPLLAESLDNPDAETLIVGDSKQAIYRFKGGEVSQLNDLPLLIGSNENPILAQHEATIRQHFSNEILGTNYRSKSNIIAFNNELFNLINSNDYFTAHRLIYENQAQQNLENNTGGYVEIKKFEQKKNENKSSGEDGEEPEEIMDKDDARCIEVLKIIKDATERGYSYRDIAILCRRKKEQPIYAQFLKSNNINIISQEGLKLANEISVALFPAFYAHFLDPENKIHLLNIATKMQHLGLIQVDLPSLNRKAIQPRQLRELAASAGYDFTALYDLSLMDAWDEYEGWLPETSYSPAAHAYFAEYLFDFTKKNGNEFDLFYTWWEQNKDNLFIKSTDSVNGVQLLTIHKAKGLEFEIVILPAADWDFIIKKDSPYWFEADVPELHPLTHIYGYISAADSSNEILRAAYEVNAQKILLDNLNLLYVATTRAVSELYLLMGDNTTINDKTNKLSRINQVIQLFLGNAHEYSIGEKAKATEKKQKASKINKKNIVGYQGPMANITIKNRSGTIWSEDKRERIEHGVTMHYLLQEIKTREDVVSVTEKAQMWGLIPPDLTDVIQEKLMAVVQHPALTAYFTQGQNIKSEQSIITTDGQEFIPDRMYFDGNKVNILDFKTGNKKPAHERQITGYASLLRQMGYSIGNLHLVYLEPLEIITINSTIQ